LSPVLSPLVGDAGSKTLGEFVFVLSDLIFLMYPNVDIFSCGDYVSYSTVHPQGESITDARGSCHTIVTLAPPAMTLSSTNDSSSISKDRCPGPDQASGNSA